MLQNNGNLKRNEANTFQTQYYIQMSCATLEGHSSFWLGYQCSKDLWDHLQERCILSITTLAKINLGALSEVIYYQMTAMKQAELHLKKKKTEPIDKSVVFVTQISSKCNSKTGKKRVLSNGKLLEL